MNAASLCTYPAIGRTSYPVSATDDTSQRSGRNALGEGEKLCGSRWKEYTCIQKIVPGGTYLQPRVSKASRQGFGVQDRGDEYVQRVHSDAVAVTLHLALRAGRDGREETQRLVSAQK